MLLNNSSLESLADQIIKDNQPYLSYDPGQKGIKLSLGFYIKEIQFHCRLEEWVRFGRPFFTLRLALAERRLRKRMDIAYGLCMETIRRRLLYALRRRQERTSASKHQGSQSHETENT